MNVSKKRKSGFRSLFFRKIRMFDRVVRSKRDLEELCHHYIVGTVPHVKQQKQDDSNRVLCDGIKESFEQLSRNLQFLLSKPGQQVIGVHSVAPDAGKTFVCINLAVSLALSGKQVLLADFSLRKPRLSRFFGVSDRTGNSSLMEGRVLEEVICKGHNVHLWLLSAGGSATSSSELPGNDMFRELLDRSREKFDFIILDNAPVSVAAEGLITAPACDLNLFVLRAGKSRKDEFAYLDRLTAAGGLKHLALMLNDVR